MTKNKGIKWDGKSRVSNDLYRKNFNEIFKKKPDPFDIEVKEEEVSDEELKEIDGRNGF
jgi:3-dehydroquinate dehydratase